MIGCAALLFPWINLVHRIENTSGKRNCGDCKTFIIPYSKKDTDRNEAHKTHTCCQAIYTINEVERIYNSDDGKNSKTVLGGYRQFIQAKQPAKHMPTASLKAAIPKIIIAEVAWHVL